MQQNAGKSGSHAGPFYRKMLGKVDPWKGGTQVHTIQQNAGKSGFQVCSIQKMLGKVDSRSVGNELRSILSSKMLGKVDSRSVPSRKCWEKWIPGLLEMNSGPFYPAKYREKWSTDPFAGKCGIEWTLSSTFSILLNRISIHGLEFHISQYFAVYIMDLSSTFPRIHFSQHF